MSDPITDKKGTVFDPSKHLHRDGVPTLVAKGSRAGCFMPRSTGAPKKTKMPTTEKPSSSNADSGAAGSPPATPAATPPAETVTPAPTKEPSFEDLAALVQEPAPGSKPAPAAVDASTEQDHEGTAGTIADGLELLADVGFNDNISIPENEKKKMARAYARVATSKGWETGATLGLIIIAAGLLIRIFKHDKPKAQLRAWLGLDEPKPVKPAAPAVTVTRAQPAVSLLSNLPPQNKMG